MGKGKCEHWDSGWCYKPESKYRSGCPGKANCDYMSEGREITIRPEKRDEMMLFVGFIMGRGALDSFLKKVNVGDHLLKVSPEDYIQSAFDWREQYEGHRYWLKLNRDWKRSLAEWRLCR